MLLTVNNTLLILKKCNKLLLLENKRIKYYFIGIMFKFINILPKY